MKHADMRLLLRDAFARVFGREPTTPEVQCLQAVASLESAYGQGWKPPGNGSHNFGAIQAGSSWNGPTFQYTDTTPQADGSSKPYVTKFRKYATPIDGAVDLVKVVYINRGRDKATLPPATEGDTLGFSRGLHSTGYYEGFGRTVDDRIANHHKSVMASIRAQALALSESLPADIAAMPILPALLRRGANGPAVVTLQKELNRHGATPSLVADGDFGAKTLAAVLAFQREAQLVADGIVGTRTWEALTRGAPLASPVP
jgi:hypothetical protein